MPEISTINENMVFILEKQNQILESSKETTSEGKEYILKGVAAQFGKENNNNRIYEEGEYLPHLDYLKDKIKQKRLVGELDHPEKFDISLNNVSHVVEDLMYNKREIYCDCIISTGGDSPVKYKAKFTIGSMRKQDPDFYLLS
jgi:hypothetical protein